MYELYLRRLLEPLGVYDMGVGSINGAELHALGLGFDGIDGQLGFVERHCRRKRGLRPKEADVLRGLRRR